MTPPLPPKLHLIANLWTLWDHPSSGREWSLERKIVAIKQAGFDGFTFRLDKQHGRLARKHGLGTVGFITPEKSSDFAGLIGRNAEAGARRINVHLGRHDTPVDEAIRMAVRLVEEGEKQGVACDIETHRNTCTETPEKTYSIAAGYRRITGRLLPLTWDFSHFAVVKHLVAPFSDRLIVDRALVQSSRQFHFRPFNGHHCQVPVSGRAGRFTPEFREWLPMLEATIGTWLQADQTGADLYVCPEMGPVRGGYNLASLPRSWDEAKRLKSVIQKAWADLLRTRNSAKRNIRRPARV